MRPLDGVLVVSLEQAIAAPYCTRLLADHGARVVKVERPGAEPGTGGDFARRYDRRARGLSSHFAWTNRSKESIALDIRDPADRPVLDAMIARADVFVQNLAPGAAERAGLGHAVLRARHPRLVTCSISGYGPGGPDGGRKAYDLLVQAEAGFLSVTGTPDAVAKAGISVVDIAAGVAANQGILLALLQRARTDRGDHVEVSMLEAMAEWMGYPMYYATDGAAPPPRSGAGHATIFPYGPYRTRNGSVLFGLQNEREWVSFCRTVLEDEALANDADYRTNDARAAREAEVNGRIDAVLSRLTSEEATERLERAGIGTGRIVDMAGLWAHPQLEARDRWRDVAIPGGTLPALKPIGGTWEARMDAVPALDQHGAALRREFGDPT